MVDRHGARHIVCDAAGLTASPALGVSLGLEAGGPLTVHPADQAALEQFRVEGEPLVLRVRSAKGWASLLLTPLERQPDRIVAAASDVSRLVDERLEVARAQALVRLGHWSLDLRTNHLEWSDEIFRLFEIDAQRFGATYEAFLERVHPEDRRRVDDAYREHLAHRQPYDLRHRLLFPDGRVKYVHEWCASEWDEAGQPLRSLGVVQDVTAAVENELALRASHELLSATFDGSPLAIAQVDPELRFRLVNRAFAETLGSSPTELAGRSCVDALPALARPLREALARQEKSASTTPLRIEHTRGATLWDWTVSPIVGGLVLSMKDVTERVQSLQALKASRNVLQSVIENVPTRVFWKDREGVYLGCNQRFAADAGCARVEDVVGRTDFDLGWKAQAELYREDDRKVRESGVPRLAYEEPQTTPDGSTIWLRTSKVPLRTSGGETVGILGIYEDVTAEKLSQDQLRAATAAAEKASRAKGEFLANMSHEIRTPMNAVLGFAELALLEPVAEPAHGYLKSIHASATDLLGVLNDILDFSKIEAGRLLLDAVPFSPRGCVERARELAEALVREKDVVVEQWIAPELPARVLGDQLRVTQVLTNLVGNAAKFTRSGKVSIRAWALEAPSGRARLRIEVSDTGIGMSASQLTRLFEPFTQADSSTTRVFGGTGLGLSITRKLVDLMGGTLEVASEQHRGTTCTVTLELPIAEGEAERAARHDYLGAFAGRRALLAEDNRVNQMLARALLGRLGFEVDVAENGRRAVEMLHDEGRRYDVVFMDMQMPELDGVGATEAIRSGRHRADIPIIAMTANVFPQDREACLRAGMNEHLAKPLRIDAVGAVVAQFVPRTDATPRLKASST
ncbi:MAG: PAS domain-containing protein [Myxococcota bacterium]